MSHDPDEHGPASGSERGPASGFERGPASGFERQERDAAAAAATGRALEDHVVVVLNETQDLVNIAGTIRAMLNMGVRRLRLVRPAEFDEHRICGIAHGADPILARVERFERLRDAVADAQHVVGMTARRRTAAFVWQHPREAAPEIRSLTGATGRDRPVALVFGREDAGLSNEDLDICDRLITVPSDPRNPSLNLAQAVLIVLYELWMTDAGGQLDLPRAKRTGPPATTAELDALFGSAEEALVTIDFFKSRNPLAIMRTLRAIARRAGLDEREARLLRAIAIEVRKSISRLARRTPP